MSKVIAKDSKIINYPVDIVYRAMTDFVSYGKWYPKPMKIEIDELDAHAVGTTLHIQNGALVKWKAKVTKFEPNKLIAIDYIDGAWLGKTFWKFENIDGKARLTLEINIEVNKAWLRFLSKFVDLGKAHSKQMKQVFTSLEKYIDSDKTYSK